MKFCRSCGSALAGGVPSAMPVAATMMSDQPHAEVQALLAQQKAQQKPMGMPQAGPMGMPQAGPMGMPPPGPMGGMPPAGPMGGMPPAGPMGGMGGMGGMPSGPLGGQQARPAAPPPPGPPGAFGQPQGFGMPPTLPPEAKSQAPQPVRPSGGQQLPGTVTCPRCATATPSSFAFCQQCGLNLQDNPPTGSQPVVARPPSANIDVQAATIAADLRAPNAPPVSRAQPAQGPAWGTAVLVNRDGSDGQRFPLAGEYLIVGRVGADIEFAEDRFLARQHARLERANDGSVKVHPVDTLNGVFRKADAPVDLPDGTTVLVGREVLRFERVEGEESKVQPLVRHGVALFGSPPREPWGRLLAIIPSGGYRDVRHLSEKEIVLGREEGDIVFRDDAFMSRRHAALTWDGRKAQITDLGSSNGTFVRLTGPTLLKHGDHVRMGDQLLRIELGK